ncbi:hypothetical protein ACTXT7_015319 [Hymenolepis weldensis]
MYIFNCFHLQSRRQQLMEQITEAQRLRDDFETAKARLLSGLQNQFFVVRDTVTRFKDNKSCENSVNFILLRVDSQLYSSSLVRLCLNVSLIRTGSNDLIALPI